MPANLANPELLAEVQGIIESIASAECRYQHLAACGYRAPGRQPGAIVDGLEKALRELRELRGAVSMALAFEGVR